MSKFQIALLIFMLCYFGCNRASDNQGAKTDSIKFNIDTFTINDKDYSKVGKFTSKMLPLALMRDSVVNIIKQTTNKEKADSIFALFRKIYADSISSLGNHFWDNDSFQTAIQNGEDESIRKELNFLGFSLAWSEGSAFVDIDSKVLLSDFKPYLSFPMKRFLEIRSDEESTGFSDDAMLLISWNQLSERIATWESFIETYPSFILKGEAENWYQLYLEVFITGMDNSRVFSFDEDVLLNEVKQSYLNFIEQHPQSKTAKFIKNYLNVLEENEFKNTDEIQDYLEKNKISSMLGYQPPIR